MFTEIYRLQSNAEERARKRPRFEAHPAKVTLSFKVRDEELDTVTIRTVTICNERFETFAPPKLAELKEKLTTTTSKEKKDTIASAIKQLEGALEKAKAVDRITVPTEDVIECFHSMAVKAVHWYPYYVRQTHYEHAPLFINHGVVFVADGYYDRDSDKYFHYIRKYNIDKDDHFLSYAERTKTEVAWLMESVSEE
ncbi:hypothetical protein GUITHDRAFT_117684 [Guillardia theta CCMP2712]|uniref:Uncharacterized protein n=1 Tax=Guillardia theta (strain CCMP2712) TaxID=905079 RepID=L1IIV4_GUITC|nr:hypothetical protein GUITHDRAFT_117684 [Guillardia theta CCMP2712]EKX36166.1 hypothetical protein GUITHDRAFT_117684 [Guillardia theta CCMP2712]|eukprot:XP_005823146.1 hypothetical protein GUITHDRAFT_117684 [Guillardia theta CCMP2712]